VLFDRAADALKLPRNRDPLLGNERRDLHEVDRILSDESLLDEALAGFLDKTQAFGLARAASAGPKVYAKVKGMGTVWDYRHMTAPNGGKIKPLVLVEHIPVIRQMSGRADLDVLRRVLIQQGLMVHHGTDAEGNVALYTNSDVLNFHARGVNSASAGTEHMHATTAESWTQKQINASAWLSARLKRRQDLPHFNGILGRGSGFATVKRAGHVTHEAVSKAAGFNDRSDPGDKYEALMAEIRERAIFFNQHGRF
jgi:hypothetical protein